jgi:hypothetical protein
MQARKKTLRPCHRPLIAALAALASGAACADEPSPWYVGVSQALTHDSNVYRIPDGRGDNYSSTGLLGGFDQPIGRQKFHGSANIRYNKYQDETTLDNTSYGVAAGWDWETIEKLSGNFNVSANQGLASYDGNSTAPTTERNLLKTDRIGAGIRWGGANRLGLVADYAHSRARYSESNALNSNSSADAGSLGVRYNLNPDLKVGAGVRVSRTVVPNGLVTADGTTAERTSNGRNFDLTADWRYSPQTGVNARLSWTRQTNSGAAGADFSGLTGALSAHYAPTGKTSFSLAYNRDAGTNGSFFNVTGTPGSTPLIGLNQNSRVSDALTFGVNYAATAKITANAGYTYRRAKIVSTVTDPDGVVVGPPTESTDNVRKATLGVSYAITRAWQLGCNLSRESRSVSGGLSYSYDANVAGCSVQLTMR